MDDVTREHSVTARTDAIRDSFARLYRLDREIAELTEEHLAPLRADKTEIKAKLREDYQIPAALLNARYASYKLERFAEEAGDATTLDVIREMFEALPIGGTVDLVAAVERAAAE